VTEIVLGVQGSINPHGTTTTFEYNDGEDDNWWWRKTKHTSMSQACFEPAVPAFTRPKPWYQQSFVS